jgi:NAD+ synthase
MTTSQTQFPAEKSIEASVTFLRELYKHHHKKNGLIAVSGGIDSAVSLTLLTKALGPKNVYAVLLPYDSQDMKDAQTVVEWNKLPAKNVQIINIKPIVDGVVAAVGVSQGDESENSQPDSFRLGNIMARSRMIVLYDQAKKLDALVCGTENKSEKYLGYFTRFGDEASDIEPIQHLYKTQVRQVATALKLPEVFLKKSPSAGLWKDQTDETELGFSYEAADQVFEELIEKQAGVLYLKLIEGDRLEEVTQTICESLPELPLKTIESVLKRVQSQQFKHEVPYHSEW